LIPASRRVEAPSRHLHESSPRKQARDGLFSDFEAIRTAFDGRCSAQVALKEDAFWDSQPTLCAKGLRVGDFGGVSLSSGFSSQLLWDSQDIPRSVELRQWWAEGGKDSSSQQLTGGSGGGMGGREVPFAERGVLDDIKARQLGYGEKPDYIGVAATLNFVRSEKLWYEACASEGCQKKVVQNTDGADSA